MLIHNIENHRKFNISFLGPTNYRGGGVIAAGCGQVDEPRRKVTRTY